MARHKRIDYEALEQRYDGILKQLVPSLNSDQGLRAVENMNRMIDISRRDDWASMSTPRAILGITQDKQTVIYGERGNLGFYRAVPVDTFRERTKHLRDQINLDWAMESEEDFDIQRTIRSEKNHYDGLLGALDSLL